MSRCGLPLRGLSLFAVMAAFLLLGVSVFALISSVAPQKDAGSGPQSAEQETSSAVESEEDIFDLERKLKQIEHKISMERKFQTATELEKYGTLDRQVEHIRKQIARFERRLGGPDDDEIKPQLEYLRASLSRVVGQYGGRMSELLAGQERISQKLKRQRNK